MEIRNWDNGLAIDMTADEAAIAGAEMNAIVFRTRRQAVSYARDLERAALVVERLGLDPHGLAAADIFNTLREATKAGASHARRDRIAAGFGR